MPRRIALIGHSGAGKSACLRELQKRGDIAIDPKEADMDELGYALSDKEQLALNTLQRTLAWLADPATPQVVAVRNDEMVLKALVTVKTQREFAAQFSQFYMVYLYKPLPELTDHLKARTKTDRDGVAYTIREYWRLDRDIYRPLADKTINCNRKSIAEVADRVTALLFD